MRNSRWVRLLAYVTGSVNQELLLRNEYLKKLGAARGDKSGQYTQTPLLWKKVLETSVGEEAFAQRIQEASLRGRPLGSETFVETLESLSDRRLRPLPVGRPKARQEDRTLQLSFGNGV
jgi:hypothetical protein